MELNVTLRDGLRLWIGDEAAPGEAGGAAYPSRRLRKGLLLADGERLLAEEGVGFGVPVVKRGLQTVFPGSLELSAPTRPAAGVDAGARATAAAHDAPRPAPDGSWRARATFGLDLVERLAGAGGASLNSRPLYAAKNALAALHRRAPVLRGALTATSNELRRRFRWETVYEEADPAGVVIVDFLVRPDEGRITVSADLRGIRRDGLTEIVLMNELGAQWFDRYRDTEGARLDGDAIDAWSEVAAAEACFAGSAHDVTFTLRRAEGARLFRGRELIGSRLAWSGFGWSLPAGAERFSYDVLVGRTR